MFDSFVEGSGSNKGGRPLAAGLGTAEGRMSGRLRTHLTRLDCVRAAAELSRWTSGSGSSVQGVLRTRKADPNPGFAHLSAPGINGGVLR